MTRLEFFQQVVEHLARATDLRLRGSCLCMLERQARAANLEGVLLDSRDLLLMGVAITQCELIVTGRTQLRKEPIPKNPGEAAVHFLSVSERMRQANGKTCWMLLMWASLAPFKHQRPQWGSA